MVAHETYGATCHNWVTPNKTKEFLKSPRFFYIFMVGDLKKFYYVIIPTLFHSLAHLILYQVFHFLALHDDNSRNQLVRRKFHQNRRRIRLPLPNVRYFLLYFLRNFLPIFFYQFWISVFSLSMTIRKGFFAFLSRSKIIELTSYKK